MCLPHLNLLNFELPPAGECKYVLTSPRSLKACRRAKVKPVELLYRSYSDVESEIGNKEDAQIIFQAYEVERQSKLAVCRSLRNELLLNGYWSWDELELGFQHEKQRKFSPKLQEGKERRLPLITENYMLRRADTPENIKKLKETPESPRTPMRLPKLNVVFDENTEGRLEKKDTEPMKEKHKKNSMTNAKEEMNKLHSENISPVDDKNLLMTAESIESEEIIGNGNMNSLMLSDIELYPNPHITNQDKENKENINSNKNNTIQSPKYSETEDINNNNIKINRSKKLPNSSIKRKLSDKKKHSKIVDHKKAFQNMKIEYSDPQYCIFKYKQVIENSVGRDLRELDVQRTQRELDAGMERWQDRVLLLQWLDAARATDQVTREIEMKVERLQQKNRSKIIIHTMNINKVREAEEMKAEELRRQVEEKKRKIVNLKQEKERIITESKSRALSIQELKEHIRNIETPETFNQKVAKISMHKKVLDSHMCARIMHRSHICLG